MKTAVVYYSKDGSTRCAAEVLAQKMGADIFELEEIKQRSSTPAAFMGAGFAAVFGTRSRLKDTHVQKMGAYERICIGTPIWADRSTPAVNTFVHAVDAAGKDVIIFTVQADKTPDALPVKSIGKLTGVLEKKGAAVKQVIRLVGASPGKAADKLSMQAQLDEKLAEI